MATSLEMSRLLLGVRNLRLLNRCNRLQPITHNVLLHQSSSRSKQSSDVGNAGSQKAEKISQAMRAYLERAKAYDDFMKEEVAEYEIGKRHLANIMGVDPDTFTQEDVNRAIEYLLPSSLHDKKARPIMKPPADVIPQQKAAQFGMDGRPYHHLFYTGIFNYYQLLHEIAMKHEELKGHEDKMLATPGYSQKDEKPLILAGSEWLPQHAVERKLNEKISEKEYDHLTKLLGRLAQHPNADRAKDFIMAYRHELPNQMLLQEVPKLETDESGRKYMDADGFRKNAVARVRLWSDGTGQVTVNGINMLSYFPHIIEREQLMFPLQLTGHLNSVDVEATVEGGGPSGQAGALRLGISTALQSFTNADMWEKMRLAGLLTRDPRVRERKKPGQEGARRKFTWKKR